MSKSNTEQNSWCTLHFTQASHFTQYLTEFICLIVRSVNHNRCIIVKLFNDLLLNSNINTLAISQFSIFSWKIIYVKQLIQADIRWMIITHCIITNSYCHWNITCNTIFFFLQINQIWINGKADPWQNSTDPWPSI